MSLDAIRQAETVELDGQVFSLPYRDYMVPLSESEALALLKDIEAKGRNTDSIKVDEHLNVLDGHNRLWSIHLLNSRGAGISPKVEILCGLDDSEKERLVIESNLKRRNLTDGKKKEQAVKLRVMGWSLRDIAQVMGVVPQTVVNWCSGVQNWTPEQTAGADGKSYPSEQTTQEELQTRSRKSKDLRAQGLSVRSIADELGVSVGTVANDLKRGASIVALGGKDIARARDAARELESLPDGVMSGEQAGKALRAEKKKQKDAEREELLNEQSRVAPIPAKIKQADAIEFLLSLDGGSADLLLTDPPYMTDVDGSILDFARSWVPTALKTLKSSGRAYICTGAYPEELQAYLQVLGEQSGFTLENVLVWTYRNTLGPSPKYNYKLNWQAIFYLKGPDAPPLDCPVMVEQFSVQDINAPDGRQGDRYHAWQKPMELGERFVRHSTKPGDLVVDPFACTGTFLLAASKFGRRAIGCDINPENIAIAVERGCHRGV